MYLFCVFHVGVVPDGTYEVCSRTTGQAAAGNEKIGQHLYMQKDMFYVSYCKKFCFRNSVLE